MAYWMISRQRVVSSLAAVLILGGSLRVTPALAQNKNADKYTVCTVTINSDNEAKLFKSKLQPSSQFEFIEIVPSRASESRTPQGHSSANGSEGINWFEDACAKFKSQKKSCDLLVISGHFGGTFFGSSGQSLTLETLEQMGCNSACSGIMNTPKEVFLFGCNTLAEKDADARTPEQYRAVLRDEVNEQGNRVFTDAQVEEIVAFRYSEFGQSNRERMSRAFSGVPHLYGFDSVAPSGKNGEGSLSRYLSSISNYAKHLEQVELEAAAKGMTKALGEVQRINRPTSPKPNRMIASAFESTNFAQCSGNFMEDSAGFCKVFDEKIPLPSRVLTLRGLLAGPGGTKYLALAKQFFERYPPDHYDARTKSEFQLIGQNPTIRKRFLGTLSALERMPAFALDLNELGEKLAWISKPEANNRKKGILTQLLNQGTLEATDLVCSRKEWPQPLVKSLKAESFSNRYSLEAMSCIVPGLSDPGLEKNFAVALQAKDGEARRLGVWFLGNLSSQDPATQKSLVTLLKDKDPYVKQMAAWALHRGNPKDPGVQKALADRLSDSKEDAYVRRDAAMAFFQAKASGEELSSSVRAALEKAKTGNDPIVAKIVSRTLSGPVGVAERVDPIVEHSSVVSDKGVKFERVKNPKTGERGWRDTLTQLVWYEPTNRKLDQYDAEMDCADKPGESLPTRDDFAVAEQHGVRDVVKGMKDKWVWSSSAYRNFADYAHDFNGNDGYIDYGNRFSSSNNAVVCVGGR